MSAGDSLKNAWGATQKDVESGLKKASDSIASGEKKAEAAAAAAQQRIAAAEKKAQQELAAAQQKFAQAEQKAAQEIQQAQQKLADAEKKAQQLEQAAEAAASQEVQQAQKELQQAQQQLADAEKKVQQEMAAAQKMLAAEEAKAQQKLAQAAKAAQNLESKVRQTVQQAQALQQSSQKAIQGAEELAQQETAAAQSLAQLIVDASAGGLSGPAANSAAAFGKLSYTYSSDPVNSTTAPCATPSAYSTAIVTQKSQQPGSAPPASAPKTPSTFTTLGASGAEADKFLGTPEGQQFLNDVKAGYPKDPNDSPEAYADKTYRKAMSMITSGTKPPVPVPNFNQPLFKLVPKGGAISDFSPYFITQADLKKAFDSGKPLADALGLPLSSQAEEYVLHQINPNPANPPTVHQSTVAPTSENGGKNTTQGGATQTLVANRGAWSKPVPVLTIPNVKPPKK